MWIILFSIILGCVMLGVRVKEYIKDKKIRDEIMSNIDFKVYDYSKWIKMLYVLFILLGIASGIYGFIYKDDATTAMGIIIALIFIGEIFTCNIRYQMFYNEHSFIAKGKNVRYKSIKHFEKPRIPFAFIKVITYNDEEFPVSHKSFQIINERFQNLGNKDKNKEK